MADTSLDRFGRFNDHQLQEEFLLYCLDQRSKFTLTIITFIILTWSVFETFMIRNDDNPTAELIYCTTSLLLSFVGFILCSILIFSPFKSKNRFFYSNCQALLLVCLNLLFMIKAIKKIHIGTYLCLPEAYNSKKLVLKYLSPDVSDVDVETFQRILGYVQLPVACPPDNSYYSLANRTAITIMVMTFQILTAVIYEPRIYLVWSCYLPTVGLVLFMDFYTFFSLIPLVVGFIVIALLLGELHYQRVQSFLNQKKIKQLLDENERNADASHAMEMRHMISNVAHDLKTPLASFTNGLDIIKEILVSTSKKMLGENSSQSDSEIFAETCASIQTCLANIRNTNAFMLMTINRCLDYTKASKGMKLIPKYETVDLREALQFPIECMSNIQERIGIKLEALSEEICTHIITDKQWLQENLLCLLSNAVKYSTEGNVTITATLKRTMSKPTIQLTQTISSLFGKQSSNNTNKIVPTVSIDDSEYEVEEYYLLFEIEDTGIGLSEEASKNLFNPFKQAQRLAGGTGLGLYSLAKRMEALKGDYGVRRRKDLNKGSLFWFTLPYKPDPVSAASKDNLLLDQPLYTKNEQSVSFNSPNTNGDDVLKILLVDDAPSILKMSSMMLKRQGHQIWTAENGEIALKKIEEKWKNTGKGFDLVLMDLQMPVMDGLEATRRLRQMEEEGREWMKPRDNSSKRVITTPNNTILCHQIIIGLSANSDHETAVEAFNAGVDDFFGKPFSLTTFNKTIERFFH